MKLGGVGDSKGVQERDEVDGDGECARDEGLKWGGVGWSSSLDTREEREGEMRGVRKGKHVPST